MATRLLENKETKISLDFGQSFIFSSEFFTSWFQPGCLSGLGDNFELNLLPKISKLYAKEMLMSINLAYTETSIDALFLSNAQKACFNRKRSTANSPGKNEPPNLLQPKMCH